jgi:hypothetical protein
MMIANPSNSLQPASGSFGGSTIEMLIKGPTSKKNEPRAKAKKVFYGNDQK